MEADIEAAKKARDEANALYAKENRGRKAIHNKLLELQGNIRVLARVRPMVEVSGCRGGGVGEGGVMVVLWSEVPPVLSVLGVVGKGADGGRTLGCFLFSSL